MIEDYFPAPILAMNWVEIVIGSIVFIFYLIGQLLSARQEARPKPRRPRPAEPLKPAAGEDDLIMLDDPQPAQRPGGDQAESLRREIDEFVRRAQGKPPQQTQTRRKTPPRRRPADTRQPTRTTREAARSQPRKEGVAEHVSKHLDTSNISKHVEQLGQQLGQTDERLESRLHEKFDHQLGTLASEKRPEEKKPDQKPDAAQELVALLSRPEGMRQMILANEILRRPEW